MIDYDLLDPGANWCPDCGLPRGVCDCEESNTMTDYLLSFSGETPAAPPDEPAPLGVMAVCPACDGLGLGKTDEEPCPRCNGDGYLYPL